MSTDHRDCKTRSSFFAHKFTITSFVETDPVQWNKEWDKALHPFSAKDVYVEFSWVWTSATLDSAQGTQYAEFLKAWLLRFQNTVAGLWADLSEEHNNFITAWLLLEERDRQTHLLNGLLEACKDSLLGVDACAMCPDIKISSMLKGKGRAYVDFIGSFTKGKVEVGENGDRVTPLSKLRIHFLYALRTISKRHNTFSDFILHFRSSFYIFAAC
jgi:hypothetical protein